MLKILLPLFVFSSVATPSGAAFAARIKRHGSPFVEQQLQAKKVVPLWATTQWEDDLDELDDIQMNRPANVGRDKVKMWGVWLDADVAGRKVLNRRLSDVADDDDITNEEKAEVYFDEGVIFFQNGEYSTSAALIEKAVELVGAKNRRGGEFQLWLAQALHASGEQGEAIRMLRDMKNHSDGAVKRVSQEILFVYEAPRLELNREDMMQFDLESLSGLDGFGQKQSLKMANALGRGGGYAKIEPGPDKYSLEWVQEQRLEGPAPIDFAQLVFATALTALSLMFFT